MGHMNFLLPATLPSDLVRELDRASLAGGFDNAPAPCHVQIQGRQLTIRRPMDESGYLLIPWEIEGVGRLMVQSATLIERDPPYALPLELARGKVHHLRSHLADWQYLGFPFVAEQQAQIREISQAFGRAGTVESLEEAVVNGQRILRDALLLTDRFLPYYSDQLLALRHQRIPKFETILSCGLSAVPSQMVEYGAAFNSVRVPLTWKEIEPSESRYQWDAADGVVAWAQANNLSVTAGPLIDFSRGALPDWLTLWEGDLPNLANFMCDYIETAVARYRGRIKRWQLVAGCNICSVLNLSEDDMLWLTARLGEAAMQMAPEIEMVVGIAQPWGEYLAQDEYTYTPLVFIDTLLRAGLRLAAIDLEMIMGISYRGSYCRDLLEVSRMLDQYAVLSTPLQVTLACASSTQPDPLADPEWTFNSGHWKGGFTPAFQAEWAARYAKMALCKPFITGLSWAHFNDGQRHRFPNCGLVDACGGVKPALAQIQQLRAEHLK